MQLDTDETEIVANSVVDDAIGDPTSRAMSLEKLRPDHTYQLRGRATNANGPSAWRVASPIRTQKSVPWPHISYGILVMAY